MSQLNVYDLYLSSLDEINVDERGQVNIARWNRAARKAVQVFIEYLTGRLDEEPTPGLGVMKNQKIGDLMRPILKREMVPFEHGLIPYPQTYDYLLDMRLSGDPNWKPGECNDLPETTIDEILNGGLGFRQIDVLSHDEIPSRVNTKIPLLKKRPCAEQYDDGYRLYNAEKSGSAFYAYIVEPEDTTLNMDIDDNTQVPVYVAQGSVNPPFDKKVGPFLARKIAQYYFLFTREGDAIAMSDAVPKTK